MSHDRDLDESSRAVVAWVDGYWIQRHVVSGLSGNAETQKEQARGEGSLSEWFTVLGII